MDKRETKKCKKNPCIAEALNDLLRLVTYRYDTIIETVEKTATVSRKVKVLS